MIFSVIVPFLNEQHYIKQCIEHLLEQDFDRHEYELIFVDNGSTDRSRQIVGQFPGIRLLTEKKGWVYTARNAGLGVARGEIIAFTDADCTVSRDWLTQIYNGMKGAGASIAIGGIYFPSPKPGILQVIEDFRNDDMEFVYQNNMKRYFYGCTNNMAVKSDLFKKMGPFLELPVPGDTEFIHRCLLSHPGTKAIFISGMQIIHLEVVDFSVLLGKIFCYGKYGAYLKMYEYAREDTQRYAGGPCSRTRRSYNYCVKKNNYTLWQKLLLSCGIFFSHASFNIGKVLGRYQGLIKRL